MKNVLWLSLMLLPAIGWSQDDRPIGVFDSGIGGMTVLEKLLAHPGLKDETFTYLGDQANMPYGNYDAAGKSAYLRELAIKFVPLKNGTVDRVSLARLVKLLPLTRARLVQNGEL